MINDLTETIINGCCLKSTERSTKRVCLFGTSANPPTGMGGHVGIASHLASTKQGNDAGLPIFDEVRILPVYSHVFNEKRKLETFDNRLAMCRLAFDGIEKIVVSDDERTSFNRLAEKKGITSVEEKTKLRVGTADLLDMLKEDSDEDDMSKPLLELTLALGADTFMNLTEWTWLRSEDVFKLTNGRIIVFVRQTQDMMITEDKLSERIKEVQNKFSNSSDIDGDNIRLAYVPTLTTVSSSEIRKTKDTSALKPEVAEYIKKHNLYGF